MWEDQLRCTQCSAWAPKWIRRPSSGTGQPARSLRSPSAAASANGAGPSAVTIGDFVCVPRIKRERRAATRVAKELAVARAQLKDLKEPGALPSPGAADPAAAKAPPADEAGDDPMGAEVGNDVAGADALASFDDACLAGIAKALPAGAPGRDIYLQEMERRRVAKLSDKPRHVQVRQGNDKWRRAEDRVSRAEKARKAADEAVAAERQAAASRLAALEQKAADAQAALDAARQEAKQAKEQLDRAVALQPAEASQPVAAVFSPGEAAHGDLLALGNFLARPDIKAAQAEAGLTTEAAAQIESTVRRLQELLTPTEAATVHVLPTVGTPPVSAAAGGSGEGEGDATDASLQRLGYRSPGTEAAYQRICTAAARARSEPYAEQPRPALEEHECPAGAQG